MKTENIILPSNVSLYLYSVQLSAVKTILIVINISLNIWEMTAKKLLGPVTAVRLIKSQLWFYETVVLVAIKKLKSLKTTSESSKMKLKIVTKSAGYTWITIKNARRRSQHNFSSYLSSKEYKKEGLKIRISLLG